MSNDAAPADRSVPAGSATAGSAPAPPAPTGPHVFDEAETRRRLNTGELYTDFGPGLEALEAERVRGKELTERFNATTIADPRALRLLRRGRLAGDPHLLRLRLAHRHRCRLLVQHRHHPHRRR